MSLRAKLEAVIYAAEEPVTLAQLATLFAAEALEWKAAQQAAASEQSAEVAGQPPESGDGLPFLGRETQVQEQSENQDGTAEASGSAEEAAQATKAAGAAAEAMTPAAAEAAAAETGVDEAEAAPADSTDAESEARRAARQREREVRTVIKQLLDELIAAYAADASGLEIREIAGGYRMATKPEYHDSVRVFVRSLKPPLKLSLPALETLAVVAYKQPVTAPEVSEIRGVESAGVLGSLLSRKLIATAGRKPVIGRPILYKTTREFLVRFGLKDLSELPSMEEFEKMAVAEIEEMEPEAVAADAAEAAAEAQASEDSLDENSPSGVELAGVAESGILEAESQGGSPEDSAGPAPEEAAASSNGSEAAEKPAEETAEKGLTS